MTHEDRGHYAKKHGKDRQIDPRIAEAVRERISEKEVPCAVAFSIVEDLNVEPLAVGRTLDLLEKTIVKCQLGLYGYGPNKTMVEPAESVESDLAAAIREALVDGRLACKAAWDIAQRMNLRKMQVSSACETLGIKIRNCQLGSF